MIHDPHWSTEEWSKEKDPQKERRGVRTPLERTTTTHVMTTSHWIPQSHHFLRYEGMSEKNVEFPITSFSPIWRDGWDKRLPWLVSWDPERAFFPAVLSAVGLYVWNRRLVYACLSTSPSGLSWVSCISLPLSSPVMCWIYFCKYFHRNIKQLPFWDWVRWVWTKKLQRNKPISTISNPWSKVLVKFYNSITIRRRENKVLPQHRRTKYMEIEFIISNIIQTFCVTLSTSTYKKSHCSLKCWSLNCAFLMSLLGTFPFTSIMSFNISLFVLPENKIFPV